MLVILMTVSSLKGQQLGWAWVMGKTTPFRVRLGGKEEEGLKEVSTV